MFIRSWLESHMNVANPDPIPENEGSVGGPSRRLREWLLLTGHRLVVSAVMLLVIAVAIVGTVATGLAPLEERTPMLFLLFALISGNFALITIVVSISQFVLARHLESPEQIRTRMNEMVGYRKAVGESTHRSILPVLPSAFFLVLFYNISQQVQELDRVVVDVTDPSAQREVAALTTSLGKHTERIVHLLETAYGMEDALIATLSTSYASSVYRAWHLEHAYGEVLPAEATEVLSEIVDGLEHVDVARRYFKTVLIQVELASLSRMLLFIGIPIQLATVILMLFFTASSGIGVSRGVLGIALPIVVTAGFVPLVLLAAYILRLGTVASRTAAEYPFTMDTNRAPSISAGE